VTLTEGPGAKTEPKAKAKMKASATRTLNFSDSEENEDDEDDYDDDDDEEEDDPFAHCRADLNECDKYCTALWGKFEQGMQEVGRRNHKDLKKYEKDSEPYAHMHPLWIGPAPNSPAPLPANINPNDWTMILQYLTEHFGKETFELGAAEVRPMCEFYNGVMMPVKRLAYMFKNTWGVVLTKKPSAKAVLTLLTALVGEKKRVGGGSGSTP
jgi:hypothetical protein